MDGPSRPPEELRVELTRVNSPRGERRGLGPAGIVGLVVLTLSAFLVGYGLHGAAQPKPPPAPPVATPKTPPPSATPDIQPPQVSQRLQLAYAIVFPQPGVCTLTPRPSCRGLALRKELGPARYYAYGLTPGDWSSFTPVRVPAGEMAIGAVLTWQSAEGTLVTLNQAGAVESSRSLEPVNPNPPADLYYVDLGTLLPGQYVIALDNPADSATALLGAIQVGTDNGPSPSAALPSNSGG